MADLYSHPGADRDLDVAEERYERAKKAIRNFRAMEPQLSAFARVLTGREDVKVQAAAGTPATDGNIIYMRPYMEMADASEHNRRVCDKRDERGVLICDGCRARQDTLTTLFHEVGHIAYDSFEAITDYQKRKALEKSIKEHRAITGSKRAKLIEAVWRKRDPDSYFEASHLISPYLPIIFNALEDARVNRLTYQAYEGTYNWFMAHARHIFEVGIELEDGSRSDWSAQPLNAQVIVGLFCLASKLNVIGHFDARVEEALHDERLNELVDKVETASSAKDIYHLGFPVLERLRDLGFCKHPDDIEPEEEKLSGPAGPTAPPTPEDLMSGGDDEDGDGEGSPVAVLVDEDLAPDEDEADDDDDAEGVTPEHVVDLRTEEADPDDDDPDDDTGAGEGGGAGDDAGADEDRDDGTADADGGSDHSDDPDADSDDTAGDTATDDDADSSPDDIEMGDVPEREDKSSGASDYEETWADDDDESDDDYDPEADSSWGDETGDSSKGSGRSGTDAGSGGANEESITGETTSGGAPDGGSPGGGGAREATDVESDDYVGDDDPSELWGDPEDVEKLVKAFGGHEKKEEHDHHVDHAETPLDREEIDRALKQGGVFDHRSEGVPGGIREHEYENRHEDIYSDEAQRGRGTYMPEAWRRDGEANSYYGDAHNVRPPEEVLGPALSKLRVVFADNRKWKHDRNRKSGRIDGRVLGRRVAVGDDRIFHKRTLPGKKDYHVLIGLDISGSTSNGKIIPIKAAGFAQAELLSRLGVDFELYAHTGGTSKDGAAMDIFIVKRRNEPWGTQQKQRLIALQPGYMNLDGHTFEYYRKRLDESDASERILMYYTDGAMPAENYNEELKVLQREIGICERRGYKIVGVGVGTDSPNRHGLETVRIDSIGDIQKVVDRLERKLQGR